MAALYSVEFFILLLYSVMLPILLILLQLKFTAAGGGGAATAAATAAEKDSGQRTENVLYNMLNWSAFSFFFCVLFCSGFFLCLNENKKKKKKKKTGQFFVIKKKEKQFCETLLHLKKRLFFFSVFFIHHHFHHLTTKDLFDFTRNAVFYNTSTSNRSVETNRTKRGKKEKKKNGIYKKDSILLSKHFWDCFVGKKVSFFYRLDFFFCYQNLSINCDFHCWSLLNSSFFFYGPIGDEN